MAWEIMESILNVLMGMIFVGWILYNIIPSRGGKAAELAYSAGLYEFLGAHDKARRYLDMALKYNPDEPEDLYHLIAHSS